VPTNNSWNASGTATNIIALRESVSLIVMADYIQDVSLAVLLDVCLS
jgi:hypothetical protein